MLPEVPPARDLSDDPVKFCARGTRKMGSSWTRRPRCPVGLESVSTSAGRSAFCTRWHHDRGPRGASHPRDDPARERLGHAHKGAARAGRALDGFRSCALTNVALLEPDEPVDSPRVVRTVGPNVMASVYRNPASDLEALLRARRGDARRAPAFPHGRVPLHRSEPRGSRADRRQPHPRHLPGRHGRGAGRAGPRARASGTSGIDVRHRRRREMARGRGVRARGHRATVTPNASSSCSRAIG